MHSANISVASLFKEMQALFGAGQATGASTASSAGQFLPGLANCSPPATGSTAPTALGSMPSKTFSLDLLASLIAAQASGGGTQTTSAGTSSLTASAGATSLTLTAAAQSLTSALKTLAADLQTLGLGHHHHHQRHAGGADADQNSAGQNGAGQSGDTTTTTALSTTSASSPAATALAASS